MPELEHAPRASAHAEFAAATWAALWLLQSPFPPGLPVTFHSDNMDVVQTAQGGTVAEPMRQARALLDGICKILRLKRNFTWEHVHGHQADPLNEMVDTVARLYSLGLLPPPSLPPHLDLLREQEHSLAWLWLECLPQQQRALFPPAHDVILEGPGPSRVTLRDLLPEGQAAHATPMPLDPRLNLRLATANILSLTPASRLSKRARLTGVAVKGRLHQLALSFQQASLDFIGMQETRVTASGSGKRLVPPYAVFLSTSQPTTHAGGCALWVNISRPIIPNAEGVPTYPLMVKSIRIMHQSPRILAATLSQMGIRFNVLVAHAHHSGKPNSEQLEWWHLLRHVHDHVLPQPVRTIVLIDANAALGE